MTETSRKPRAITLPVADEDHHEKPARSRAPRVAANPVVVVDVPDSAANERPAGRIVEPLKPAPRGFGWGALFFAALFGLLSLAAGLAADQFIRDLFARNTWLGWAATALTALAVIAALAQTIREMLALTPLAAISRLRARIQTAQDLDDVKRARDAVAELLSLYGNRPETARGREALASHSSEIIDGSDLISLAERDLLAPLDQRATAMVLDAAKRVSVVTAVSPRALVDLAYVLVENTRLIRRLAELYGGRPGTLGFWRLARNVIAHLAATGVIAAGDSLLQQLVGHGLAARLSAKLGEGVINGLLTARIGIAAIDVCRPAPFINAKRPGVTNFLSELVKFNGLQNGGENDSFAPEANRRDPKTGRLMK